MTKMKIMAISGSTRSQSYNLQLLKALKKLADDSLDIDIFEGIAELPHFNPDVDDDKLTLTVKDFRTKVREADGVIICTPEYVFSLPGTLKNAIEWTVASGEFYGKPLATITASTSGEKAHESLLLIMKTLEAKIDDESQLLIQGVRSKVRNGEIVDELTLKELQKLLNSLAEQIDRLQHTV